LSQGLDTWRGWVTLGVLMEPNCVDSISLRSYRRLSHIIVSPHLMFTSGKSVQVGKRDRRHCYNDTHLCCEWGSYGSHTTFMCRYLSSWCYSLLVASMGCLGSPSLGFVLCSIVWRCLSLASNSQIQSLFFCLNFYSILTAYR